MKIDWRGAVTGVVSALLTTAVLWAVGLARGATLARAVPSKAVVAFGPVGVSGGLGTGSGRAGSLHRGRRHTAGPVFNVGETGGKDAASMSVANLPPHSPTVTARILISGWQVA